MLRLSRLPVSGQQSHCTVSGHALAFTSKHHQEANKVFSAENSNKKQMIITTKTNHHVYI